MAARPTAVEGWLLGYLLVAALLLLGAGGACAGGGNGQGSPPAGEETPEPTFEPAEGPAAEAAREFVGLSLSEADPGEAVWDLVSAEIRTACTRALFVRGMIQFWYRFPVEYAERLALAAGKGHFVEVARDDGWVVLEEPHIGLRVAVVEEDGQWRVHPDLSTTYCAGAPPLPSAVQADEVPPGPTPTPAFTPGAGG